MLPPALVSRIETLLPGLGIKAKIMSAVPVGGGCIHNASKLATTAGTWFIKWNSSSLPGIFSSEAHGIRQIRAANAIKTPEILLSSDPNPDDCPGFILMEWIESEGQLYDPALLGEKLAALHLAFPRIHSYGLEIDNYIGSTPQKNSCATDWIAFYRDQRLQCQVNLAVKNGGLTVPRRLKLDKLLQRLDQYLGGIDRRPSLLHGDLWVGNILTGPCSEPYLLDPAVYFGDREAEIAFTELFGGFPPRFYQAYNSVWPLLPGYTERRDLYNLYHALNHLNIFGASYGPLVDAILRTYVGE